MLDKLNPKENQKTTYFGGRITKEQSDFINKICKENNVSKSKILDVMLDTLIEEYKNSETIKEKQKTIGL